MTAHDLDPVARLVVERWQAAPAAVVAAARFDGRAFRYASGAAGTLWVVPPPALVGPAPSTSIETLFDLASVTKPTTALIFARCQRAGLIHRDECLAEVLPELTDTPAGRTPLDLLMAHRAGLLAHDELFIKRPDATQPTPAEALARAATLSRPACEAPPPPEGYPPIYSDLGYMLTGAALERRCGLPLDALLAREFAPILPPGAVLGSARQLLAAGHRERIAPTEQVAWRGGVLRAVVHDENAWVLAAQGSAGHAGLFANAAAVLALGTALLDVLSGRAEQWLTREQLQPLLRPRPGGSHCAGFDRRSGDAPSSGAHFGPQTFGHLGFTGTSLWIDPEVELAGVLLSNRVHPSRELLAIRDARPAVYDALYQHMLG